MNRISIGTAVSALVLQLILPPYAAAQQRLDRPVMDRFAAIEESVIRIRTVSALEYREDGESEDRIALRPYSIDGTGVVVGEMWVNGQLEYLILTNHHVADASNYVRAEDGYLRVNPSNTLALPSAPEESYAMEMDSDSIGANDIMLIEMVRLVRGDMALMRTVGAKRKLTVFSGPIGYKDGDLAENAPIIASGYPYGGRQMTTSGRLVAVDHLHELGLPHKDLVISMPVHPGQSGGPVFLVEGNVETGEVEFRLIGLIHARDRERSYAVPFALWRNVLAEFPEELRGRMPK